MKIEQEELERQVIERMNMDNPWWTTGLIPADVQQMNRRLYLDSFYKLGVEAAKIFKCHERSYYIYYMKMRKRGIITTDANTGRPVVAPQYDVEQFKNAKYVVLKIN